MLKEANLVNVTTLGIPLGKTGLPFIKGEREPEWVIAIEQGSCTNCLNYPPLKVLINVCDDFV